MSHGNIG